MILTILLASIFNYEQIISVIVGTLVTYGFTNWFKNQTGLQGAGATIVAFLVSFIVAIAAFIIATLSSGSALTWEMIPQSGFTIFSLATVTYKLIMADSTPTIGGR